MIAVGNKIVYDVVRAIIPSSLQVYLHIAKNGANKSKDSKSRSGNLASIEIDLLNAIIG